MRSAALGAGINAIAGPLIAVFVSSLVVGDASALECASGGGGGGGVDGGGSTGGGGGRGCSTSIERGGSGSVAASAGTSDTGDVLEPGSPNGAAGGESSL